MNNLSFEDAKRICIISIEERLNEVNDEVTIQSLRSTLHDIRSIDMTKPKEEDVRMINEIFADINYHIRNMHNMDSQISQLFM